MNPDNGNRYILSYIFIRRFSWMIALLLSKIDKIKPNHVSVLSLICGFFASYQLAHGNWIVAAIFMILWATFDCVDGELARYTQRFTKSGGVIERINSDIQYLLWIPGFSIGLYLNEQIGSHTVMLSCMVVGLFNIARPFLNKAPDFLLKKENTILMLLSAQFKQSKIERQVMPLANKIFILWRNLFTQFGIFEIGLLLIGIIDYFSGIELYIFLFYWALGGYLLISFIVLLAIIIWSIIE